jgi:ribosomal subunit interface protein
MKIQFSERNVEVTETLRAHVAGRLGLALGRFAQRIERVVVHFSNEDGARAARETRCQLGVSLRPRVVKAEDRDPDLFVAVDRATDRLARSVARALEEWDAHPRPAGGAAKT